jgi:hypothetical protein
MWPTVLLSLSGLRPSAGRPSASPIAAPISAPRKRSRDGTSSRRDRPKHYVSFLDGGGNSSPVSRALVTLAGSEVGGCAVAMSYEDWQRALETEFFDGRYAGRTFWLFVDDDVIESIAVAGGDKGGLSTFLQLVESYAGGEAGTGIFSSAVRGKYRAWLRTERAAAPPVLPALATTVLAATRMQDADGVSAQNYYRRLREILRLDASSGAPNGYTDVVIGYWLALRRWAHANRDRVGRLLVPDDPYPAYVGYPISQALWRQSDTDLLAAALWDELGESFPRTLPSDLNDLARYLVLHRAIVPPRARRIFASDEMHEVQERLLESIVEQPPPPDTPAGQAVRARRVHMLVRARPGPELHLAFVAPRDARWPRSLSAVDADGQPYLARSPEGVDGYYLIGDLQPTDTLLHEGFQLETEFGTWVFDDNDVLVLGPHPELSLATTPLEDGQAAIVVLRGDEDEPGMRSVSDPSIPHGWRRYDHVMPQDILADDLAAVVASAKSDPLELIGGLRIKPSTYLAVSPPAIRVTNEERVGQFLDVSIDDKALNLRNVGGAVELPQLSLGRHELRIGPRTATIMLVDGLAPACSYDPGESIRIEHGSVSGAYLDPPPVPPRPRPVVACASAREVVLLGASPSEVESHSQSVAPSWLKLTPLHSPDCEIRPEFEVVWLIERFGHSTRCHLLTPVPPSAGTASPLWVEHVLDHVAACDSGTPHLRSQYVAAATSLAEPSR